VVERAHRKLMEMMLQRQSVAPVQLSSVQLSSAGRQATSDKRNETEVSEKLANNSLSEELQRRLCCALREQQREAARSEEQRREAARSEERGEKKRKAIVWRKKVKSLLPVIVIMFSKWRQGKTKENNRRQAACRASQAASLKLGAAGKLQLASCELQTATGGQANECGN